MRARLGTRYSTTLPAVLGIPMLLFLGTKRVPVDAEGAEDGKEVRGGPEVADLIRFARSRTGAELLLRTGPTCTAGERGVMMTRTEMHDTLIISRSGLPRSAGRRSRMADALTRVVDGVRERLCWRFLVHGRIPPTSRRTGAAVHSTRIAGAASSGERRSSGSTARGARGPTRGPRGGR
jgi:hypothetical protein